MTDRERFETWAKVWAQNWADVPVFSQEQDGSYSDIVVYSAWAGWQASRKQALEEAIKAMHDAAAKESFDDDPHARVCFRDGVRVCDNSVWALIDPAFANPEGEQG